MIRLSEILIFVTWLSFLFAMAMLAKNIPYANYAWPNQVAWIGFFVFLLFANTRAFLTRYEKGFTYNKVVNRIEFDHTNQLVHFVDLLTISIGAFVGGVFGRFISAGNQDLKKIVDSNTEERF